MRLGAEKFIVHLLGFKSPTISVCYAKLVCRVLSIRVRWSGFLLVVGPVDTWVTSWAAMVPGAVHVCKGLLPILAICSPHGKGENCDCLFTDGELEEMTRDFLGATQENKTYLPLLGEEHNFP